MQEIYDLCDKIIKNKNMTKESLKIVLTELGKRKHTHNISNIDRWKNRAYSMNYRAKTKYNDNNTVSSEEIKNVLCNARCAICGTDKDIVADHIVPLYKGGKNTIDNIQPLCKKCNMEKGVS